MNNRQLAQVGLGLIGVWALLDALSIFSTIAFAGAAGPHGSDLLVVAIPLALLLGLSYVLVFRGAQLAATIAPVAPDAGAAREHGAVDISRTLVVLLGVMLFVQAAPLMVNAVLAFFAAGEFPDASSRAGPFRGFIGLGVQVAIALFLIMRPERLLAYVHRPPREHGG